jgi:hypothetical protein
MSCVVLLKRLFRDAFEFLAAALYIHEFALRFAAGRFVVCSSGPVARWRGAQRRGYS